MLQNPLWMQLMSIMHNHILAILVVCMELDSRFAGTVGSVCNSDNCLVDILDYSFDSLDLDNCFVRS
jgi:hypothetical protein